RPVLVGRLERDSGRERVSNLERGRVIDRRDLDPSIEGGSVRRRARFAERAAGERHPPTPRRQRPRKRTRDLRRAATWEKEQRRTDTAPHPQRRPPTPCRARLRPAPARPPHPPHLLDPEDDNPAGKTPGPAPTLASRHPPAPALLYAYEPEGGTPP